jgi:hypothetical protein
VSKLTKLLADGSDVGIALDERAEIRTKMQVGALLRALLLAVIATAFWYVLWFGLSLNLPAWAGLLIFVGAFVVGYGFARTIFLRSLAEEIHRRRDLKKVVEDRNRLRSTA